MMKTVAIISFGYFWFPCEPGTPRVFQIANKFVEKGYKVECITTGFQHFEKRMRNKTKILAQNYPFKITFIDVPKYKKNIDIRRVISNIVGRKRLRKYLNKTIRTYDAVYTTIPANDLAAEVTKICKKNNIPCIVDIQDLWPEAMHMIIKKPTVRKLLLWKFTKDAEYTYKYCNAVIGTSDDYTYRAFKNQKRSIPHETIYVSCDFTRFDNGAAMHRGEINKPKDEIWVTYAGSIGTSYDIKTLILAGKIILEKEKNNKEIKKIKIHILGTGPNKEECEQVVRDKKITNVIFWGFTSYEKMAAVLKESDVLINSFVKDAPQSFVNKICDYLAAGKPIVNTLMNPLFMKFIDEKKIGVNVEPGDETKLSEAIIQLVGAKEKVEQMKINAREIGEKAFDSNVTYPRVVDMIEQLI